MELEDFKCPNCLNEFDDTVNCPRLLSICGHTLCDMCINTALSENEDGNIICKEDGIIYSGLKTASCLPKNIVLIQLLIKAKTRSINILTKKSNNYLYS